MKKSLLLLLPFLAASLTLGYYRETGEAQMYTYVFFKKSPTFQMKFENIFANLRDDKKLSKLDIQERQKVIDYCKYRLGIDTTLETQDDLERCKAP
jgi:hypothetical protein